MCATQLAVYVVQHLLQAAPLDVQCIRDSSIADSMHICAADKFDTACCADLQAADGGPCLVGIYVHPELLRQRQQHMSSAVLITGSYDRTATCTQDGADMSLIVSPHTLTFQIRDCEPRIRNDQSETSSTQRR